MTDYRTQGERPFYPPEPPPVEPARAAAPAPASRVERTATVVVRRYHAIVNALFSLGPFAVMLTLASAFAGRTTLTCVREVAGTVPRCVGRDESAFLPVREEFLFRSDDDVRAVEIENGDSSERVLHLPRSSLRAGISRREVGEVVTDARAFLHDREALRFERSRSFVTGPLLFLFVGLLGSAFVKGVIWSPTTLTLDLERRTLRVRRRGPWWRRERSEDVVFDLSGAKFVRTSPREIDDSGWEKLVLDDGVERGVAIGSSSSVREASRTLNEELRADYEKRGKVPKELTAEIEAQRRHDEAIRSFSFDD
ncbi:MAG: hypothetical protein JST00_03790 [Deltaproteobacteria bacterium]|nr:hypothetical protein [Deltaproteobacteria bacterium]